MLSGLMNDSEKWDFDLKAAVLHINDGLLASACAIAVIVCVVLSI
jgi:hypothetical protein